MAPPRKAAKQVKRGGEEVPREGLVDDDSEEDSNINDAGREERRREKAVKRAEHMLQVSELRAEGLQRMSAAGMHQHRTESVGDCWLIALLAGHEVDVSIIGDVSPQERKNFLTPWRMKLADFAPHIILYYVPLADSVEVPRGGVHFGLLKLNSWEQCRIRRGVS